MTEAGSVGVRDSRKSAEFFDGAIALIGRRDLPALRTRLVALDYEVPEVAVSMAFTLFRESLELILLGYSRGDDVRTLRSRFVDSVEAWDLSLSTDRALLDAERLAARHSTSNSMDHYQQSLWMVAFAILFDVDDELFDRVVAGLDVPTDALIDRLIAFRRPGRPVSSTLFWPKPYGRLVAVLDSAPEERVAALGTFLGSWYNQSRKAYWWGRHLLPESNMAKYFGYWCVEAAAVAILLDVDDSALADNPYYPAALTVPRSA